MIKSNFRNFVDRILEKRSIDDADAIECFRNILENGIETRDEADVLIALDRAVKSNGLAWGEGLTSYIVDFVVWTSRPTGHVNAETARWITASLGNGIGPTLNAERIAFDIVKEAEQVDEVLLNFTLNTTKKRLENQESKILDLPV